MLSFVLTVGAVAPDWLLHSPEQFPPATATKQGEQLVLTNGLVTRTFTTVPAFACVSYQREGAGGSPPTEMLRVVRPEAQFVLDGRRYTVGGMVPDASDTACEMDGCPDAARRGIFTDPSTLAQLQPDPSAFTYHSHAVGVPAAPFEWTPGTRHAPSDVAWPPRGVTLNVTFVPPASAPASHRDVVVTVSYEVFQGAPLLTKRVIVHDTGASARGGKFLELTSLNVELLALTQPSSPLPLASYPPATRQCDEARDGGAYYSDWSRGQQNGVYAGALWAELDAPHGGELSWQDDPLVLPSGGGAPGAGEPLLNASYSTTLDGQGGSFAVRLNPSLPGTEDGALRSFRVVELSLDSAAGHERNSFARRRARRMLAPAVQENPIFMHLTADTHNLSAVTATLDQMAAVGFELAIFSFGSGFDLESTDETFLATVANFTSYARARGIEVGAYDLIALTRGNPGGNASWRALGGDGQPNGNACFASGWVDFLTDAVLRFVDRTGFAAIETDGPYGGQPCASTSHAYHEGVGDSTFRQNVLQARFFSQLKAKGLYIHQPDSYFYHGASKTGMGYNENQYSLPRWEDLTVSRAGMYDDTFSSPVTQGWMFVAHRDSNSQSPC